MAANRDVNRFYDVDLLGEVATNLVHGWGYNFYRAENQLRADDQLIRSKVGQLLGFAQADVTAAETAYRRAHIPAPTRAAPFPDPVIMAKAQGLEAIGRDIGALIGRVQAQPVPANDRMTERYRDEAETLDFLRDHDRLLVGQAALLRSLVEGLDGTTLLAQATEIAEGLAALRRTLEERAAGLMAATRR